MYFGTIYHALSDTTINLYNSSVKALEKAIEATLTQNEFDPADCIWTIYTK